MGTNPFLHDVLNSMARKALTGTAVWLVTNGWMTEGQTEQIIAGVVILVGSIIWSVWQRHKDRILLLLMGGAPQGTTVAEIKQAYKSHQVMNPSVMLLDTATPPPVTAAVIESAQK